MWSRLSAFICLSFCLLWVNFSRAHSAIDPLPLGSPSTRHSQSILNTAKSGSLGFLLPSPSNSSSLLVKPSLRPIPQPGNGNTLSSQTVSPVLPSLSNHGTPVSGSTGSVNVPKLSTRLATTVATLPSVILPPSGVTLAPSSASSNVVVLGGLLKSLSSNIRGVDLKIPKAKSQVIEEIENSKKKVDSLHKDLGGSDDMDLCGSGSNKKRLVNPFKSLADLAGDVTKIVGCTSRVLSSLKNNLEKDTPNPELNDDLLDNLSTLAVDAEDENNKKSSISRSESGSSQLSSSNIESSQFSSGSPSPSTLLSSTLPSSSWPSSSSPSSSSAAGTGCIGCCPSDIPVLPTTGTPAVTAAPSDIEALDKRSRVGRFRPLDRRINQHEPISIFKNCWLRTPNGLPVTTPEYPGGANFYSSDKQGALGTLTAVSRYYRSTNTGMPACTPTITKLDAAQWTYTQQGAGVPENDKISVDHAYEINFLKSFMNSEIDATNGITCGQANTQFFDTGNCPANRLASIFGALPSYDNPDFVAMSQWLNGDAKGWVLGNIYDPELGGSFNPGSKVRPFDDWSIAEGKIRNKMRLAQILVEAGLIINADNVIPLMQRTNNRIYKAFQNHDTYLSQHAGLPRSNFGWASRYKKYMNQYMKKRNGASSKLLPPLLAVLDTDLTSANNIPDKNKDSWNQWNSLHKAMKSHYGSGGSGAGHISWSINWEWNTNNVKRSELEDVNIEKAQACTRSTGLYSGNTTAARIPSSGSSQLTASSSGRSSSTLSLSTASSVDLSSSAPHQLTASSSSLPSSALSQSTASLGGLPSSAFGQSTASPGGLPSSPFSQSTASPGGLPSSASNKPTASSSDGMKSSRLSLLAFSNTNSITRPSSGSTAAPTPQQVATTTGSIDTVLTTGTSTCEYVPDMMSDSPGSCQCSSGTIYTTVPVLTSASDECGYTTFPSSSLSTTTSQSENPWPYTYTDPNHGPIIACESFTSEYIPGFHLTECAGAQTTIGQDSAIWDSASAAAASSSQTAVAQPIASGACFPYHDVNDLQNMDLEIDSFCESTNVVIKPDGSVWDPAAGSFLGISHGAGSSSDPAAATSNNNAVVGFLAAENAPQECQGILGTNRAGAATLACSVPLKQLITDCPYNGGNISNACGQWWLQTCPLEEDCPVGCPGGAENCGLPWPPPSR